MSERRRASGCEDRPPEAGASGFTLIEILVVLVVLAVVSAAAAPMLAGRLERLEARAAARDVASALRRARGEALGANLDAAVAFDAAQRAYGLQGGRARKLPAGLDIGLVIADSERIHAQAGRIRFFPDGSSTGGVVTLADRSGVWRVDVDWLTGRVRVLEGGAPS